MLEFDGKASPLWVGENSLNDLPAQGWQNARDNFTGP
jgi:hypothetical protein